MGRMTLKEAADIWEEAERRRKKIEEELKPIKAQLKTAGDRLKEHFRSTGRNSYDGRIQFTSIPYTALDTDAVRSVLTPAQLKRCEVERHRESLSLL